MGLYHIIAVINTAMTGRYLYLIVTYKQLAYRIFFWGGGGGGGGRGDLIDDLRMYMRCCHAYNYTST